MDKLFNDNNFQLAAQWAIQHDFFVAGALSEYQSLKHMDSEQLAAFLGCSQQDLLKLALCRKPNTETPSNFRKDVERIASYAGVDRTCLAQLFREVESLSSLRSAPQNANTTSAQCVLVAARDRTEEEVPENKNHSETVETANKSELLAQPDSSNSQSENESPSEPTSINSDEFEAAYRESLAQTLDLDTWLPGEDLASLYSRLGLL